MKLRRFRLEARAAEARKANAEVVQRLEGIARTTSAAHYSSGWRDGAGTTLRLLLGEPANGVTPFRGELPPDVRAWAEAALARLDRLPT
jgi:hypothetical protein